MIALIGRRQLGWLAATVGWTLFVWLQRARNALGDASVEGASLAGVLLLCALFVLGSLVVGWLTWRARRGPATPALVRVVWLMTAWNTVVWASRITGIAVSGDHAMAFVAVHAVIGLVSVMLWVITAFSIVERYSGEIAPTS